MAQICMVRGISEVYADLILTLIVLSVSGALIAGVSAFTRSVDYDELNVPLTYALLVNGSCWMLILCNYGDDDINYTVLVNRTVIHQASLSPHNFTVTTLSLNDADAELVEVLVNGEFLIKPQVIKP